MGPGLREDDLACCLAHLAVLRGLDPDTYPRVPEVLAQWQAAFELEVDAPDLRARTAAVLLSLVAGAEPELCDVDAGARRLLRRPTAGIAGLERLQPARAGLHRTAPGCARVEVRGHRVTEDVDGVVGVGHPQRHPQVGVRPQVLLDHAGRTLRRQDQVQPQRPSALGDVHDAVHELGHLLHQRRELVDDDHEARRAVGVPGLLQGHQVLGLLSLQQVLAVPQFGPQRGQRPPHQVWRQVRDQAHRVGQLDAIGEGCPALVVDEEERQPVGTVGSSHAQHPGLQELRFARARRAPDEGVGAVLAQVEVERGSARVTDQGAQVALLAPADRRCPVAADQGVVLPPAVEHRVEGLQKIVAGQRRVGHLGGQVGVVVLRRTDVGHRSEHAGKGVRAYLAEARGRHGVGPGTEPDEADQATGLLAVEFDERAARGRQLGCGRGDPDDVDAGVGTALRESGGPSAVNGGIGLHHQHDGGHAPPGRRAAVTDAAAGGGRLAVQPRLDEALELGEQSGSGGGAVGQVFPGQRTVGGRGVRQPFQPLPVGPCHR